MKTFTLPAFLLLVMTALVSCSDSENIDDVSEIDSGELGKVSLFTGSNTSGKINVFDFTDFSNVRSKSFRSASRDSDGIHYDPTQDCLFEASRSESNVLVFQNLGNAQNGTALAPSLRSDVQVENPRDIAVSGDMVVVSADAKGPGDSNKFYVYQSTPDAVRLLNVYETGNQHWGIFLSGNTLYAARDNSGSIAVYEDFFSNESGELTADDIVTIEGAQSLRGVTYDEVEDCLFLADVGNPLDDSDGSIHTIRNFSVVYSGLESFGIIDASNVSTMTGANTMLGNPVDIEYDSIGKVLYAAERSTNGGMALAFTNLEQSGDVQPVMQQDVSGISSIYLNVE
jgi:6-phosphogluconolactonase (cycloisomerase 2 family)